MKQIWSNLYGSPIALSEEEGTLGRLNGVFMNPENGQVIAYLVGLGRVLAPSEIEQWKPDHIQIASADALVSPYDILRLQTYGLRRSFLYGKKVRSQSGKGMGRVDDFTIDTMTNSIISFSCSKGFWGLKWDQRIFSISDVFEVTENHIVLSVEPEQKVPVAKKQKALLHSLHQG